MSPPKKKLSSLRNTLLISHQVGRQFPRGGQNRDKYSQQWELPVSQVPRGDKEVGPKAHCNIEALCQS